MAIAETYFEKFRYEKDPVRVRKKLMEILKENNLTSQKPQENWALHRKQSGNGGKDIKKRKRKDYLTARKDP